MVAAALVPFLGATPAARAGTDDTDGTGDTSAESTADDVVGSVLSDLDGTLKAVAGAKVSIWWVPGVQDAEPGDELPVETLGSVLTAADGTYRLPLAATGEMLRTAAANGGYLNLEVGVLDEKLGKAESTTVIRKLSPLGVWGLPEPVNTDIDGTDLGTGPDAGDDAADGDPAALATASSEPDENAAPEAPDPQAAPRIVLSEDSPDVSAAPGSGTTSDGGKDTSIPVNTKVKNPGDWHGGVGSNTNPGSEFIGCAKRPQSDHRNDFPKGSTFTRNRQRAAKITGAVNVGPIKVGATSGFSSELDVYWNAVRGHGIWLCGTNYVPKSAGVIHAQNRP